MESIYTVTRTWIVGAENVTQAIELSKTMTHDKMSAKKVYNLKELIEDYAQACVDLSWSGSRHPDDMSKIEEYHKVAKRKLYEKLK